MGVHGIPDRIPEISVKKYHATMIIRIITEIPETVDLALITFSVVFWKYNASKPREVLRDFIEHIYNICLEDSRQIGRFTMPTQLSQFA